MIDDKTIVNRVGFFVRKIQNINAYTQTIIYQHVIIAIIITCNERVQFGKLYDGVVFFGKKITRPAASRMYHRTAAAVCRARLIIRAAAPAASVVGSIAAPVDNVSRYVYTRPQPRCYHYGVLSPATRSDSTPPTVLSIALAPARLRLWFPSLPFRSQSLNRYENKRKKPPFSGRRT